MQIERCDCELGCSLDIASPLEIARSYHDKGWAVTPVAHQTKRPLIKGWQQGGLSYASLDSYFGTEPINIGVVLGEVSDGLVDVDFDDPAAIKFAEHFLPRTDCVFGRPSNPRSHHIYTVSSPGRHLKFKIAGKPILELRGNGCLTVFLVQFIRPVSGLNSKTALTVIPAVPIGLSFTTAA
jgi:Bifunctional DNA primase/polymerase, N-terminal